MGLVFWGRPAPISFRFRGMNALSTEDQSSLIEAVHVLLARVKVSLSGPRTGFAPEDQEALENFNKFMPRIESHDILSIRDEAREILELAANQGPEPEEKPQVETHKRTLKSSKKH